MSYASKSIDRRAEYYARCAGTIAADPIGFYARAEKGRRFLESRRDTFAVQPSPTLSALFARVRKTTQERAAECRARVPGPAYVRGRYGS